MELDVLPLTLARWPDVETVFNAKGCSMARGCWCMYYRQSGSHPPPTGVPIRDANRAALRALASAAVPPGLVGYLANAAKDVARGTPVGWVSLGPREHFAKLRRSPVMKPVDALPVWAIVCFVVPKPWRGRGAARALLRGAIDYARAQGATMLEAYPVDRPGRSRDDASMWFGAKSMYDAAGFQEVARRKPARPVVRLALR